MTVPLFNLGLVINGAASLFINRHYRPSCLAAQWGRFVLVIAALGMALLSPSLWAEEFQPYTVETQPYITDETSKPSANPPVAAPIAALANDPASIQLAPPPRTLDQTSSAPTSPPAPQIDDETPLNRVFSQQEPPVNTNLVTRMGLSFLVVLGLLAMFFKWVFPWLMTLQRQGRGHTPSASKPSDKAAQKAKKPPVFAKSFWDKPGEHLSDAETTEPAEGYYPPNANPAEYAGYAALQQQANQHANYPAPSPVEPPPLRPASRYAGLAPGYTEAPTAPMAEPTPTTLSWGLGSVPSTVLKRFVLKKNQYAEFVTVWDRYFLVATTQQGSVLLAEIRRQPAGLQGGGEFWTCEPSQVPANHPAASWLYEYPQLLDDCLAMLHPEQPTTPPTGWGNPVTPSPEALYGGSEHMAAYNAYAGSYAPAASDELLSKYLAPAPQPVAPPPASPRQLSAADAYWMQHHQPAAPVSAIGPSPQDLQAAIRQQVQQELAAYTAAAATPQPAQPVVSPTPVSPPVEAQSLLVQPTSPQPMAPAQASPRFQPDIHSQRVDVSPDVSPPPVQSPPPATHPVPPAVPSAPVAPPPVQSPEPEPVHQDLPDFLGAPPAQMAVRRLKRLRKAAQHAEIKAQAPVDQSVVAQPASPTPEPNPRPVLERPAVPQPYTPPPSGARSLSDRLPQTVRQPLPPPHVHEGYDILDDYDDTF